MFNKKPRARWLQIGAHRYRLRCPHCRKARRFDIIEEPVARKVHKRSTHRLRVVAVCVGCSFVIRITRGPAN